MRIFVLGGAGKMGCLGQLFNAELFCIADIDGLTCLLQRGPVLLGLDKAFAQDQPKELDIQTGDDP